MGTSGPARPWSRARPAPAPRPDSTPKTLQILPVLMSGSLKFCLSTFSQRAGLLGASSWAQKKHFLLFGTFLNLYNSSKEKRRAFLKQEQSHKPTELKFKFNSDLHAEIFKVPLLCKLSF